MIICVSKQSLQRTIGVQYMILIIILVSLSAVGVALFSVMQFVYIFIETRLIRK